jgi:hypothetical protein
MAEKNTAYIAGSRKNAALSEKIAVLAYQCGYFDWSSCGLFLRNLARGSANEDRVND